MPPDAGRPAEPDDRLVAIAHQVLDLARAGDAEQLAAYLRAGVPVNLTDAAGNTLVMLAAYHGHADAVRLLTERGAAVDRVNDRGQTPLAGAVFKGEDDVVRALLDAGADPEAGTPTARQTAAMFGRPDLLGPDVKEPDPSVDRPPANHP